MSAQEPTNTGESAIAAPVNEIENYLNTRYVSTSEAVNRILGFKMHDEKPDVYRLDLHLPDQHFCVFPESTPLEAVRQKAAQKKTSLLAFFDANNNELSAEDREKHGATYADYPLTHTFRNGVWTKRKKGRAVGRMFFSTPGAGEIYYLQWLLHIVKSPPSYEYLRTFRGTIYDTFREACMARGLLQDDGEYGFCLEQAGSIMPGRQIRELFASTLAFGPPLSPADLWKAHLTVLCDDLQHDDNPENAALLHLETILGSLGKRLADYPGMPTPVPTHPSRVRYIIVYMTVDEK